MATALPLEGDGLVENLFQYLWSTDDFGRSLQVRVPPTVIYRGLQPVAWYFTSRKCGRIKRKNRVNITAACIEQSFTKRKTKDDIVAYYLQLPKLETGSPVIEYLDAEALHDFLFKRSDILQSKTQHATGILQQFTFSKGARNSTLRAIWSPKLCLLERRENVHAIHDGRFSVYERGVTFEEGNGVESHSRPDPVRGSILPGMVQQLCEQVVDHVTRVSYHKIRIVRMVLRLQVDADDRLWLLWSSSLRLQPPVTAIASGFTNEKAIICPLDIVGDAKVATCAFAQASNARSHLRSSSISFKEDGEICLGQTRCASCAQVVDQHALLPTTYKAVLAHFQQVLKFLNNGVEDDKRLDFEWPPNAQVVQQGGGVGFGICRYLKMTSPSSDDDSLTNASRKWKQWQMREMVIPPVIRYVHPTLRPEDFSHYRQDPIFLHKTVGVCEHCCLVYADYATATLEANALGIRLSASAPALLRPVREKSKYLDEFPSKLQLLTNSLGNLLTRGPHTIGRRSKPPASAWKPVMSDEGQPPKLQSGPRRMLHSLPMTPQLPPRIDACKLIEHVASYIPLSTENGESPHQQNDMANCGSYAFRHMMDRLPKVHSHHRLAALGYSSQIGQSQPFGANDDAITELQLEKKKSASPYSIVLKIRGGDKCRNSPRCIVPRTKNVTKPTKKKSLKKKRDKGRNDLKKSLFISSREAQAAAEHRGYLEAALLDAQVQLEHIESLATLCSSVPIVEEGSTEHNLREAGEHLENGLAVEAEQQHEESDQHKSEFDERESYNSELLKVEDK